MSNYKFLLKYIIIGDSAVGKSCILLQYTENCVRVDHDITIGVEFGSKTIKVNESNIKLQIWDTAGQENFRSIVRSYYRSAIGALLVYDICRSKTFHQLQKWIEEIRDNGNPSILQIFEIDMTIILCGNKVDKESERQVSTEQGQRFAEDNGFLFLETSAKDGTNINLVFQESCEKILERIEQGKIDLRTDVFNSSLMKPGVKVGRQYVEEQSKQNEVIQSLQNPKMEAPTNQKKCC